MNAVEIKIIFSSKTKVFIHLYSVGSLGKNGAYATAEEIHVRNCSFNGTLNGARIKTWQVTN